MGVSSNSNVVRESNAGATGVGANGKKESKSKARVPAGTPLGHQPSSLPAHGKLP
jgi:hypothetical protein